MVRVMVLWILLIAASILDGRVPSLHGLRLKSSSSSISSYLSRNGSFSLSSLVLSFAAASSEFSVLELFFCGVSFDKALREDFEDFLCARARVVDEDETAASIEIQLIYGSLR